MRCGVAGGDDHAVACDGVAQGDGPASGGTGRDDLRVDPGALIVRDEHASTGRRGAREDGARERGGQAVAERDRHGPDARTAQADRRTVGHVHRERVALRPEIGDAARRREHRAGALERGQGAARRRDRRHHRLPPCAAHVQAAVVERAAHAGRRDAQGGGPRRAGREAERHAVVDDRQLTGCSGTRDASRRGTPRSRWRPRRLARARGRAPGHRLPREPPRDHRARATSRRSRCCTCAGPRSRRATPGSRPRIHRP